MTIALLSISSLFAQTDAEKVAKWQFPIGGWFPNATAPEGGVAAYPRSQATAQMVADFDAATADFDATWTSVAGNGNVIGSTAGHILGLAASNKGAEDFKDAAFKVLYDESNMYILLQWTDDDVTGTESAELCLAPYFRLDVADEPKWYARYSQFGANKLLFDKNGFNAAMMVNFDAAGAGAINWGGTTETLTNNLFLDNKTATGSKTVKWIITVGFPALTGELNAEFNVDIWKALNEGKGISFDLKVTDVDADDALNADATPVKKPAEYWWSSTSNECWQSNMFAGFLNAKAAGGADAEFVAKWQFPIEWWFPNAPIPAGGIEAYPRSQASAQMVANFDAAGANFDATWGSVAGNGNVLGSTAAHAMGLAASNKGADDFKDAAFKVLYDESNMYILLQWTDDDVTGSESAELCMAPYFRLDVADEPNWYARYNQFGANKLLFDKNGFNAASMVNVDAEGVGTINWGGTTETLTNNLYVDNKTAVGSKNVKWIITIGYPALTGEFRPEFNVEIWKALNEGKGISFDMKVNDIDGDDALNTATTPEKKPAEYWWSSTSNDCWQSNMYAGFLNALEGSTTEKTDAEITANWQFPIEWWFPNAPLPAGGIAAYPRSQASAVSVASFDAVSADFDATWAVAGKRNVIGSTAAHAMGLAASNKGADDFKDAAFKVLYDESNMYILVQWTDDDVTGTESAELCLAPYFRLDVADEPNWYARYNQFGANKLLFDKNGFNAAMMVNVDEAGVGTINWGGTTETLTNNLFIDNKTASGSKTVKWIITIGYAALTGEFRPEFNVDIWKALSEGKGISFDMKVNDIDGDDAFNTATTPEKKPAEYLWSSTSNDCWQSNMYAGFLDANGTAVGIDPAISEVASIFGKISNFQIQLTKTANVAVYNVIGQQLKSLKNVNMIDLSDLTQGIYIIRANNETLKIYR